MRLRLLERVGTAIGFSPEGRAVRVWVRGMPGADETEVVRGTITEVRAEGAILELHADLPTRVVLAVPREPGWGLQALWFSFIAVDVFALDGDTASPPSGSSTPTGHPSLGRWFIRLGTPAEPPSGDRPS